MSTINKLEKAMADAQGLAANLKTFSFDTNDQKAKEMFNMLSTNAENIAKMLQERIKFVKIEEPQYNENS